MILVTVGTGETYETWAAALAYVAGLGPLGDDYTLRQVADTAETATGSTAINLNGHDLTLESDTPHDGDPTVGWKSTSTTGGVWAVAVELTGAGVCEVKDLHVAVNATGAPRGISISLGGTAAANALVHDCIVTNESPNGIGVRLYTTGTAAGRTTQAYNLAISGWDVGVFMNVDYAGDKFIENVSAIGAYSTGITFEGTATGTAECRNCIADGGTADFSGHGTVVGENNASQDVSAADANWAGGVGTGNITGIVLASEFISQVIGNTNFVKLLGSGSLWDGGSLPSIVANTLGIRGNARPYRLGVYGIGADEFAPVAKTVGTGATYATWSAAMAYLDLTGTLTEDILFEQVADTAESQTGSAYAVALAGHHVICRSAVPHVGDPTVGHKSVSSTSGVEVIKIALSDAGLFEVRDVHIAVSAQNTNSRGIGLTLAASSSAEISVHDCIVTNSEDNSTYDCGIGIEVLHNSAADPGSLVNVWNCETYGWQDGCYIAITYGGDKFIENVTAIGAHEAGISFSAGSATGTCECRNCIAEATNTDFLNTSAVTGYSNASVDTTAANVNWALGSSSNLTSIVLTNEFISTTINTTNFLKLKHTATGVCDVSGSASFITDNTLGIRGNARPGTDTFYSIGADEFLVLDAPTVTDCTPDEGRETGGTNVTITGTNFIDGATVTFDGATAASITFVNPTSITCDTPVGTAGLVDVVVINPDDQEATLTDGFLYRAEPTVISCAPNNGALAGGTSVTITGTGFASGATVTFDGLPATLVVVETADLITCVTPATSAGDVDVVVTNDDAQFGGLYPGYTYNPLPTVTSCTPDEGPAAGGTSVTIIGTGFMGGPVVEFDGVLAANTLYVSPTEITCDAPAHAPGAVDVVVRNLDTQESTPVVFTYIAAPTVISCAPDRGPAGTVVIITGTGFQTVGITQVEFDGVPSFAPIVSSDTELTCTAPAHADGLVDVKVINPDSQEDTLLDGYTYITPIDGVGSGGGGGLSSAIAAAMAAGYR